MEKGLGRRYPSLEALSLSVNLKALTVIEGFLLCREIKTVFIAVSEDFFEHCEGLFREPRIKTIRGGKNRAETVAALAAACREYDGARGSPLTPNTVTSA